MSDTPQQSIFISHAHTDQAIAVAIRDAVRALFGHRITVNYSTNDQLQGGIPSGTEWFAWIGKQVREAKVALILLTPASVQSPWVLWEAGAVAGAALANEGTNHRKLCPVSYHVSGDDIPRPLAGLQLTKGLEKAGIKKLFTDMIVLFTRGLDLETQLDIANSVDETCDTYLKGSTEALRTAPMLVTEAAVQEWLERIDALKAEGRFSETGELHYWLNIAFGRGGNKKERSQKERPLDLRIHRRLGELYARARDAERAAREFDLARQLAPRDVYVLRKLGKAYLDRGNRDEAAKVIGLITELDDNAFVRNAENAALKARWYKDQQAPAKAAEVLEAAFEYNPQSLYLVDVLAQARLASGERDKAARHYAQALTLIDDLRERTVWTAATGFTAALVVGDRQRQQLFLDQLKKFSPSSENAESIRRGVQGVMKAANIDPRALVELDLALGFSQRTP